MKTIVFIFVPIYVEKGTEAPVRADVRMTLRKTRRILFSQHPHLPPFWTWFVDNPRRPSLDRQ